MQKACECESARPDSELNRFQDPARAIQNPDSAPRPAICIDLELERQVKNFRFRIPRQHFLFTLLHIFKISSPRCF
jgi:hypothetical protein